MSNEIMKSHSRDELKKFLMIHKLWVDKSEGGKRANLTGANLRRADLTGADLTNANLANVLIDEGTRF